MSSTPLFPPPADRPSPGQWHAQHTVRIYWEDTDAGGIVFYGNYLKFMERARTEWLAQLGFAQERMRRGGEGMFVVSETQLRYLKPARLDDLLTVSVQVTELGRASVVFAQEVWRGQTLLCQGRVRIGWVEPLQPPAVDEAANEAAGPPESTFRPSRIPVKILAILPQPQPASGD